MTKLINLNEDIKEEPLVGILHYVEEYPKTWEKGKKTMPVRMHFGALQLTRPVDRLTWFMQDAILQAREELTKEYEGKTCTKLQWDNHGDINLSS